MLRRRLSKKLIFYIIKWKKKKKSNWGFALFLILAGIVLSSQYYRFWFNWGVFGYILLDSGLL
jgi:hypothetical protein